MNKMLILLLSLGLTTYASDDWCYQSQVTAGSRCKGPELWKTVNEECGGNKQSPIDINTINAVTDSKLNAFTFTGYEEPFFSTIKNNGQTVVINIPEGATINGGNLEQVYKAKYLQFHWGSQDTPGSEHTLNGKQYPMEMQILHIKNTYLALESALKDSSGVVMLGFFFKESGSPNEKYNDLIEALAKVQHADNETPLNVTLNSLLPNLSPYYRYDGSMTTPSCSQSVIWFIFEDPIPLSKDQLGAFYNLKYSNGKPMIQTFRPLQPDNSRSVYRSCAARLASFTFLVCVSWTLSLFISA